MKKVITFILILMVIGSAEAQVRIILEKSNGVYYIPCQVNGLNMKFIFDSGASDVTISLTEALFMLKNNYLTENDILGTKYYQIANGDIQEGTKIILTSINIGGYEIKNVEASVVHNEKAPLLLGQSALSKLGNYSFDYSTNSLIIGNGSSYINSYGCVSGNCINGFGTYIFSNGDKYIGDFLDGKKYGRGTYTYLDGSKHEGYYKDDKANGRGILILANGQKYEGNFINGDYNGLGTLSFPSGQKYVGEFKDNKYNGYGTYTFQDGEIYEGFYKDGKQNGYGVSTFPDGEKYVGDYKDNEYHGFGTFTFLNGSKHVGYYQFNKKNGYGTFIFSDGAKYEGNFKDDKFHGFGTYIFPNGEKYVGEFKDGSYIGNK